MEYNRATYKDSNQLDWTTLGDPVGTKKYDGAHFILNISSDGTPRFISRRPSVKGHYPDRTEKLPHLSFKLPQLAGNQYAVELIHTGLSKENSESHPAVSGILNSLPDKAIATQKVAGPVRAVLLDVKSPHFSTYRDKINHLHEVEGMVGKPDVFFVPPVKIGREAIEGLIEDTRNKAEEGAIITSLSASEDNNPRIKVKHFDTYNLKITGITQEIDKNGVPKNSAGGLRVSDATGREVAIVGTGLSRKMREEIWARPNLFLGKPIQVKARPNKTERLVSPVYNGEPDGDIDTIPYE